jgi:CRISPR-associated endoribonuclease Cas6/Csy4 subtype I-F
MQTHFIEFKVVGDDSSTSINSIMNRLHGYMRSNCVNLGVGFPEYCLDRLGTKVRVFGSSDELQHLLFNDEIESGVEKSLFTLSVYSPKLVDLENVRKVRFVAARNMIGNIEKELGRRQKRYEKRNNCVMSESALNNMKMNLLNKVRYLPYFTRKSNGKTYPIFVEKVAVDKAMPYEFNSHGLGNSGGYVYNF